MITTGARREDDSQPAAYCLFTEVFTVPCEVLAEEMFSVYLVVCRRSLTGSLSRLNA